MPRLPLLWPRRRAAEPRWPRREAVERAAALIGASWALAHVMAQLVKRSIGSGAPRGLLPELERRGLRVVAGELKSMGLLDEDEAFWLLWEVAASTPALALVHGPGAVGEVVEAATVAAQMLLDIDPRGGLGLPGAREAVEERARGFAAEWAGTVERAQSRARKALGLLEEAPPLAPGLAAWVEAERYVIESLIKLVGPRADTVIRACGCSLKAYQAPPPRTKVEERVLKLISPHPWSQPTWMLRHRRAPRGAEGVEPAASALEEKVGGRAAAEALGSLLLRHLCVLSEVVERLAGCDPAPLLDLAGSLGEVVAALELLSP